MQEPVNTSRSELWTLSLRDLFYKYVRFLPVFVLSVAFCLFVSYIYLRYATRVYSAGSTFLIKSESPQGRGDKFEDLFMSNKAQNIQSEIEILRSMPLMEKVVKKLNLQVSYSAKGKLITTNIYKQGPFLLQIFELTDSSRSFTLSIKFSNKDRFTVNNESREFQFGELFRNTNGVFRLEKNIGTPGKEYIVTWQPSYVAASGYAGAVQVSPKGLGTGILNLSIQTTNPQLGADILNQLMNEYIQNSIEQKNITLDQQLDFINTQLTRYDLQLDSLQADLLAYQQRNDVIDIQAQSGEYFGKISESERIVMEQEMKLNVANMIEDYLSDKRNEYTKVVVPSSLGLADNTLNDLVGSYNKAQLERKALIDANVPENNPLVKQAEGQIEKLRESVAENLNNIKSSYNSVISRMRSKGNVAQGQIKSIPLKAKELLDRKRKVETIQTLYGFLKEKKEETDIAKASNIPNSRVINYAAASGAPIKPNRRSARIMAIVLGLALPAMFIFISELLNDKISTRYDIEKITPAPILGEIGHSYASSPLVVTKTTRKMVAEQFRIIRSNLQYVLNKETNAVILVTSSFSGEGKSFVTMNIGAVHALAGKRTIILEFDIRKPKILSGLNIPKGEGITNFLVGKAQLPDLVKPVPGQENLFVMGCGPVPPNPSELLLDQRVADLFAYLRQNFDMVIVDTAPVGMVSDAQTLGKFADCTLYLVRQGHTFKKQVALIDEFYQENKLPKVSIVINDVKVKPGYGYYGYGRYGYGYGYGYGGYYDEEIPPKSFLEKAFGWMDLRKLLPGGRRR